MRFPMGLGLPATAKAGYSNVSMKLVLALSLLSTTAAVMPAAAAEAAPVQAEPARAEGARGSIRRGAIVPLYDVHQHMMSASAQALIQPHPELPAIALPADLDGVLRAREKVSGSPPVGALFAEDAIIWEWQEGRWWKGHDRINRFMNFNPRNARWIPKAYSADVSAGFISGGIRIGDAQKDEMNFVLGLRKNAAGRWEIASEITTTVNPPVFAAPVTAEHIIELMDDAGIRSAFIHSVAYWFGSPLRDPPVQDQAAKTRAENDWTIAETAKYPDRLIPFCSTNPLQDYAIAEMQRCAKIPAVKGMKLHLANARVDLKDPQQIDKLRQFFRAANAARMPIFVHIATPYLKDRGEIFLDQIMPEAPDVPIYIAHMGNSWDITKVFADAIAGKDPRTKNLYFDLTQSVPADLVDVTPSRLDEIVETIRKIGTGRIFFGTDMDVGGNPSPRAWWKTFGKLPLTDAELRDIADNVPVFSRR